MPVSAKHRVVFPAPVAPITPKNSPFLIVSDISFNTVSLALGYIYETLSKTAITLISFMILTKNTPLQT